MNTMYQFNKPFSDNRMGIFKFIVTVLSTLLWKTFFIVPTNNFALNFANFLLIKVPSSKGRDFLKDVENRLDSFHLLLWYVNRIGGERKIWLITITGDSTQDLLITKLTYSCWAGTPPPPPPPQKKKKKKKNWTKLTGQLCTINAWL